MRTLPYFFLALTVPLTCVADDALESAAAAKVLDACIPAAWAGEPVDGSKLAEHFKSDRKGEKWIANKELPAVQIIVNNKGTFRCTLMGKKEVAGSAFARTLAEKVHAWPGFTHMPIKDLDDVYGNKGDAAQGLRGVVVMMETTPAGVWQVTVWDVGVPKPRAAVQ